MGARWCPFLSPRPVGRVGRACAALLLAASLLGCEQAGKEAPTTGRTVRQEKPRAGEGLGGYRSVEMPEQARRNLVEADPSAPGAAAYWGSVLNP